MNMKLYIENYIVKVYISMSNNDIISAIDNYYKLKKNYERNKCKIIDNKRDSIVKLSKKNKKKLNIDIKVPCILCKRKVNTIFGYKGTILYAKCGDVNKPCELNIEIDRGYNLPFDKYYNGYIPNGEFSTKDKIQNIKNNIMKIKMEILFNLLDEDIGLNNFEKNKKELNEANLNHLFAESHYLDFLDNIEEKYKSEKIQEKNDILKEIKELHKQYTDTKNVKYITEIIDITSKRLFPKIDEILDMKYNYNLISYNTKEYNLRQIPSSYSQTEVPLGNVPSVKSNIYEKTKTNIGNN